jgi:hypothetical protein
MQAMSVGSSCGLEGQGLVSETADQHATPGGTTCWIKTPRIVLDFAGNI